MSAADPAAPLREHDIRADDLKAGQQAALEHDIQYLHARRAAFVEVSCPACGADDRDAHAVFIKRPHTYHTCARCSTIYVSPRPPAAMLGEFYAQSPNYAYWNAHVFPRSEAARRERIFRPRARRVVEIVGRHAVAPGGTLVEVGPGFGTFAEEVRALGVMDRIVVIEPTPDLAATCRSRGLEVIEAPIEQVDEATLAALGTTVVASFECIEHLFDPGAFVRSCARVLQPGGLLLLTCPSAAGFDIALLRGESDAVDHEHLNYFTPDSLGLLLEACGFDVLETITPGLLDVELVRKKVQEGRASLRGQPFLERVVMDPILGDALQSFLQAHGLSSHLWMVGRRRPSPRT
ncbi:MAG: methyltransferase domain-containing protein [Deltaproteobacteria bacterium]|nr:methyltransferase domain-containing protein [Deltaproteobacteria bacterium]